MTETLSSGMRAVKIAAIVMGVLIVVGTVALMVMLARHSPGPAAPSEAAAVSAPVPVSALGVLSEPPGTSIAAIATAGDRLAIQLRGGGADRVVFVDPRTAAVTGRISLPRE